MLDFDKRSHGLGTFRRNWRPRGLRHRVPGGLFLNNTHMKRGHFVGIGGSGGSGSLDSMDPKEKDKHWGQETFLY